MAQAIPMIMMAVGTAVSSYGMVQQGKAQEKQAEAQAELQRNNALQSAYDANFNASAAEMAEKEQLLQGQAQRDRMRRELRRGEAKATAQLSRRGLDVGAVSFQDVLSATIMEGESQIAEVSYKTAMSGQNIRAQGAGFRRRGERAFAIGQFQSSMTLASGRNARKSANIGAAGNFISGMGSAASAGQSAGVFGNGD